MTQYQERDRVHHAPPRAPRHPRPDPVRTRSASASRTARIDCDSCPIAGHGCGDCMVALLGPVHLRLDAAEQGAVDLLVKHGLVCEEDALEAYAVPDLPDWVVESWPAQDRDAPDGATRGLPLHAPAHRATG